MQIYDFLWDYSFFTLSVEKLLALHYTIGWKNSRHFFIQSKVKWKPITTRSHTFSRASRQQHVISFDWLPGLSTFFVIGSPLFPREV